MSKIKIFGLGGLNENGKNMYIVDVDDNIFVFDAGLKYPNSNMLGVDYIIPNFDYLKENIKITKEDKNLLLGIIGTLTSNETKQLISEVLSPIGYNLMVTPKEIDFQVNKISELLSNGINNALNENITHL